MIDKLAKNEKCQVCSMYVLARRWIGFTELIWKVEKNGKFGKMATPSEFDILEKWANSVITKDVQICSNYVSRAPKWANLN